MAVFIFILILFALCVFAVVLEIYVKALKNSWRDILPKNKGVVRLCLVLSIVLSVIAVIEIPSGSGIGQLVCGRRDCHLFGEPDFLTTIAVFCAPFIVAKVIEFIVEGFRK